MWGWIRGIGRLIGRVLASAQVRGLTDAVLDRATDYVREAAQQELDNAARREWAVGQLVRRLRIPESIARLAVELAVQRVKAEVARI